MTEREKKGQREEGTSDHKLPSCMPTENIMRRRKRRVREFTHLTKMSWDQWLLKREQKIGKGTNYKKVPVQPSTEQQKPEEQKEH